MSKVTIQGDASGTGIFTIASPNSNTDRTLTLPDEAGTVLTSAGVPASAMPAGSVIQVVNGTRGGGTVSTASLVDVSFGATASITPTSASSKILIIATGTYTMFSGNQTEFTIGITRNGTTIPVAGNDGLVSAYNTPALGQTYAITILDAPATTSATTYLVVAHRIDPGTAALGNGVRASQQNIITLMEIAA
jgi:hypothetical protein